MITINGNSLLHLNMATSIYHSGKSTMSDSIKSLNVHNNGLHVYIEWKVDKNLLCHFEVERTKDMIEKEKIKDMFGFSTEKDVKSYILIDTRPEPGLNYYRVKMMNEQGKISYSAWHKVIMK